MCGISGIINKTFEEVNRSDIKTINDLVSHRGPDDEGFYFGKNIAFGHRRLSILDLSQEGHQPMTYLSGRYTITYNGEIYNYLEIREMLAKEGYLFHSGTDTEVILASYDKWGKECVKMFNGMWAFALYDKEKNIVFCSRDRFGIKPFYYTEVDNKFIFGSEIKQLLEFYTDRYVNKKILLDYLVIGFEDHTNETFFENIFKLEQAHNLIFRLDDNSFATERYYDIGLDENIIKLDQKESTEAYGKSLENSVKLRLRSDVKVGTCLSGGLDSSSIAAVASALYSSGSDEKFTAIHAKSTQAAGDESIFAKEVSEHCGLSLKIVEPSNDDFTEHIDEVVYAQEEPFGGPSVFMQYFVMKKAKEENCKVMLDGQGGDETLLGYERYYPAHLISLGYTGMIKGFFNAVKNSKLTLRQLVGYIVYFTNSKVRLNRLKKRSRFIKKEYVDSIDSKRVEQNSKNYLNIFNLQHDEIFKTQMPHLLRYEDKNSMRNSVETRLPFIDYKVLETAVSLNGHYKIHNGWTKYVLRRAVDTILPKSIVWRKNKFGFEAPTGSWLGRIENEMQESINSSAVLQELLNQEIDITVLDDVQKWKLFNIAKWEHVYNVKIN
ncbi:MAG: asparagine synthase (glutamine-hydrolyzing) [Helicobacteraceae bacterium 4484_230]|nr:MAG: asparagine synthase (glutamine-hydrolyzing) [Helicobacteraceae bacterium 4484_230]